MARPRRSTTFKKKYFDNAEEADSEPAPEPAPESARESSPSPPPPETPTTTKHRRRPSANPTHAPTEPSTALSLHLYPTDARNTRSYHGPTPRHATGLSLARYWYADHDDLAILQSLLTRWEAFDTLPCKLHTPSLAPISSPWLPEGFAAHQQSAFATWLARFRVRGVRDQKFEQIPLEPISDTRDTVVVLGPYGNQTPERIAPGAAIAVDPTGAKSRDSSLADGRAWVVNVGGIPLSISWAPTASAEQTLAVCVVPHADQEFAADPAQRAAAWTAPEERGRQGCVQLWQFAGQHIGDEYIAPSLTVPRRIRTLTLGWGRVTRGIWCPVPMPGGLGLLALLCEDGAVRIIEVNNHEGDEINEYVHNPLITLSLAKEDCAEATAFTWLNINRLATGHRDGSITLWSLNPLRILSRHPVHYTHIVAMQSAYPSNPYLVASTPVSGYMTLTDLTAPATETTTCQHPHISTHPNLLAWADHLQTFVLPYPSSNPLNMTVMLAHAQHFPASRRLMSPACATSAMAAGVLHPFVLLGLVDGTLWACNPARFVFAPRTGNRGKKLKVMEHEFRPPELCAPEPHSRGTARFLHGWAPVENQASKVKLDPVRSRLAKAKRSVVVEEEEDYDDDDDNDDDDGGGGGGGGDDDNDDDDEGFRIADPDRAILHEPRSRVVCVEWNPNEGFGCWAAAAMASGLVRVMDLGVIR